MRISAPSSGSGACEATSIPKSPPYMLLRAIYQYVYWRQFLGVPDQPARDRFVDGLLETLDRILSPVTQPS